MTSSPIRPLRRLALAALPALLLAACGGGGDDNLDDRLDLADPKVRVVHAVPFAPSVTLYRNDRTVSSETSNLPYRGASNYFDVSTSTDRWEVRTATSPSVSVGSLSFDARRGNKYTLVAVASSDSLTELAWIDDPYNKSLASDNARVRVFNAAFNTSAPDVYLSPVTADIAVVPPSFAAVGYKTARPASGNDSTQFEGGSYRLRLTAAGSKTPFFSAPVTLPRNADWLLLLVPGGASPTAVRVLVVQSDSNQPATELASAP